MTADTSTVDIPRNPTERRGWIIWQLRNLGWSLSRIAREEGVSLQAVSAALLVPSSHLHTRIAETLGLTRQQIWPEFYAPTGEPLGRTRPQHRSTRPAGRNVQDGVAA